MTATTSIPMLAVESAPLETVTFDLYRDIHKGIRNELFAVTVAAGNVDPGDDDAVVAVGARAGATCRRCSSRMPSTKRTSCSRSSSSTHRRSRSAS